MSPLHVMTLTGQSVSQTGDDGVESREAIQQSDEISHVQISYQTEVSFIVDESGIFFFVRLWK